MLLCHRPMPLCLLCRLPLRSHQHSFLSQTSRVEDLEIVDMLGTAGVAGVVDLAEAGAMLDMPVMAANMNIVEGRDMTVETPEPVQMNWPR